jgi:hypothetical protein
MSGRSSATGPRAECSARVGRPDQQPIKAAGMLRRWSASPTLPSSNGWGVSRPPAACCAPSRAYRAGEMRGHGTSLRRARRPRMRPGCARGVALHPGAHAADGVDGPGPALKAVASHDARREEPRLHDQRRAVHAVDSPISTPPSDAARHRVADRRPDRRRKPYSHPLAEQLSRPPPPHPSPGAPASAAIRLQVRPAAMARHPVRPAPSAWLTAPGRGRGEPPDRAREAHRGS